MFIYIILTRACAHTDRKSPDFNVVMNGGDIEGERVRLRYVMGVLITGAHYIYSY